MPELETAGATIHYETRGDPDNRPVFALHGGPGIGDGRKPLEAFEPLADAFHLVVPDHRGCGRSSLNGPFTNGQFAADVNALREHLGCGRIALIGGSYGGFITQQFAVDYPDALEGFLLRDTAATPEYDRRARETARERLPDVRERGIAVPKITEAELEDVMEGNVGTDERFRRLFHGMLPLYAPSLAAFDATAARDRIEGLDFHAVTHDQVFSEVFPNMDYTVDLPGVTVPALVTVGRHDWITPVAASEEIHELLPESTLVIYEDSGHNPHFDQRDQYLRRTREFLQGLF